MLELKIGTPIFTKNNSEFDVYVTKIQGSNITVTWEDEDSYDEYTQVVKRSQIKKVKFDDGDEMFELPSWTCTK